MGPDAMILVFWMLSFKPTFSLPSFTFCYRYTNNDSQFWKRRRSLIGCSPWGRWGSDTTERLHFHFSLSCIGEGNGNPLQCSCLENPRDREAWWAAVYGVAQSRTQLKWLSSSSRYADDTTLMAESEEELKSFLMKLKEESEKVGLKLNILNVDHSKWS